MSRFERLGEGAIPSATANVQALLRSGKTWSEICRVTGLARRTVAYHAKKLRGGKSTRHALRHDWDALRAYVRGGHSRRDTVDRFKLSRSAVRRAVALGVFEKIVAAPLSSMLVRDSQFSRKTVKRRLIEAGRLKDCCALCGLKPVWNGKPLVLRLDHENGNRSDNREKNLRLICPNCDSQLPTYCARNRKLNKGQTPQNL